MDRFFPAVTICPYADLKTAESSIRSDRDFTFGEAMERAMRLVILESLYTLDTSSETVVPDKQVRYIPFFRGYMMACQTFTFPGGSGSWGHVSKKRD